MKNEKDQLNNQCLFTIFVSSADSYSDVLSVFFQAMNKYWKNANNKFLLATGINKYAGVRCYNSGVSNDEWTSRTIGALKHIDTEYVLLMCDDVIINNFVHEEQLNKILNYMKKNDVKYFRIKPLRSFRSFKIPTINNKFYYVNKKIPYGINLQVGIFKKDFLIELLGDGTKSCWEIENSLIGESQISQRGYFTNVISSKKPIISFYHGVEKGKWYPNIQKKLIKEGFSIDPNRNKLSFFDCCLIMAKSVCRHILPSKIRKLIKKVAIKCGCNIQTKE